MNVFDDEMLLQRQEADSYPVAINWFWGREKTRVNWGRGVSWEGSREK